MVKKINVGIASLCVAVSTLLAGAAQATGAETTAGLNKGIAAERAVIANAPGAGKEAGGAKQTVGTEAVRAGIAKRFPNTPIKMITETPFNGLYEVVIGNNAAFTDASGQYFIFGHLFDMEARKDLTAERLNQASLADIKDLPVENAIKVVRGNGSRVLYVFSDIDCPFCRKLEPELAKLKDVTIYTFPYPIDSLHPEARAKAERIWCSSDKAAAWDAYMKTGKIDDNIKPCPNPIAKNVTMGEKLGIRGTPTMISGDGRRMPGYADAEKLAAWLDGATSAR